MQPRSPGGVVGQGRDAAVVGRHAHTAQERLAPRRLRGKQESQSSASEDVSNPASAPATHPPGC